MRSKLRKAAVPIAIAMALFHLYTGFSGVFTVFIQRGMHLVFAMVLIYLITPMIKNEKGWMPFVDTALAVMSSIVFGYIVVNWEAMSLREGLTDPVFGFQKVLGVLAILLILEAVRRTIGNSLAILAACAILYALWGGNLPGILAHRGWSLKYVLNTVYFSLNGIYSSTLGTSATYAALFIIMGSFMSATKISEFFTNIASSIAGKKPGGPAKIAVIASGLFGLISGASTANVYSTGVISIPLMKKLNYKPYFAGAVEAVASTGGQILPPVMGAVAFIMADITGIPYIEIAKSAAIPALLYYFGVYCMVHLVAKKDRLVGLPADSMPSFRDSFKDAYLMIPIVVLVVLMTMGYSVARSVTVCTVLTFLISFIKKRTRLTFKDILKALENAGYNMLILAAACACAGIITGVLDITGLALRFTGMVMKLSTTSTFVPLLLTMLACIILGMGVPTVPAYVIVCSLCVGTLINMGLLPIQAHLFALYFAVLAAVTPPVAVAAFAGASIAGSNPNRTGFEAFKLALPGFIIPFAFAYNPALLLVGDPISIILAIVSATCGVLCTTASMAGYLEGNLNILKRALLLVAGILLILVGFKTDAIGYAILAMVYITQRLSNKKRCKV